MKKSSDSPRGKGHNWHIYNLLLNNPVLYSLTTLNEPVEAGNVQEEDPSSGGMIVLGNSWIRIELYFLIQRPLLQTAPRRAG